MLVRSLFCLIMLFLLLQSHQLVASHFIADHEAAHRQGCLYYGGEASTTYLDDNTATTYCSKNNDYKAFADTMIEAAGYQIRDVAALVLFGFIILWGMVSVIWVSSAKKR